MRALSNPEWAEFMTDVNVAALNLPPWGGVVQWGGLTVVVFVGADGNVWASDITGDSAALATLSNLATSYDSTQSVWYYQLPQQTMQTLLADAQAIGQGVGEALNTTAQLGQTALQAAAGTVGQAAGALTAPLLSNLAPILIAALVILGVMYLPRRS